MLSPTTFLAAAIHCAAGVPPSISFDVARVESGFNPYAIAEILPVNARTSGNQQVVSHRPTSKTDAIRIAARLAAQGRRYSVGLMQITSTNFHHYGVTASDLFNPCINLSIYELILTDCYRRGGTLKRALSCYYSGNFHTGQQAESAFNHTSYVQRIGYVIPSTREDRRHSFAEKEMPEIHYPTTLLRGSLTSSTPSVLTSLRYPDAVIRGNFPVPVTHEEK